MHDKLALYVLIFAIGISGWVQYARMVRARHWSNATSEYVQAARLIGIGPFTILRRHILPNVMGPVLVIATIHLAIAIITEATLSFLGVGVPPTAPSLGTLIRIGNSYLFSGMWWISIFRASRWWRWCCRSTCWATGCATPSTLSCAETLMALLDIDSIRIRIP